MRIFRKIPIFHLYPPQKEVIIYKRGPKMGNQIYFGRYLDGS
jgi:hypothetical protein